MPIEFVQHRTFESNGVQLAAKEWGTPDGMPIIAPVSYTHLTLPTTSRV